MATTNQVDAINKHMARHLAHLKTMQEHHQRTAEEAHKALELQRQRANPAVAAK